MRKALAFLSALLLCFGLSAQDLCEQYIAKYSSMAVDEMYRSGVPASITLAQGLLESGYGTSSLAVDANNHFGIKCHRWTGMKVYHDDDAKNECFRKYESVADSYSDHSDFLRYSDRYKFLFDLETSDYKGWCYGLKSAGYATSPTYATRLIELIEKYQLYKYDVTDGSEEDVAEVIYESAPDAEQQTTAETAHVNKQSSSKRPDIRERRTATRSIPASPKSMESLRKAEGFTFSLSRDVYECNSVKCVLASDGETYKSIADEYGLFLKEILSYNEESSDRALKKDELVYIAAKRKQTDKGLDMHICSEDGETLRDISQRYGVRLKSIIKMNNGLSADSILREGDSVVLRKR